MKKNALNGENLTGNDRFEGYSISMLEELARILGFQYELYLVPDNKFGQLQSNNEWNGIMGEIVAGVRRFYHY